MSNHNRSLTTRALYFRAGRAEDGSERIFLGYCATKGVIRFDARKFKRRGFNVGPLKGLNIKEKLLRRMESAFVVHPNQNSCDLKQSIGTSIKSPSLYVDNHREKSPKPARNGQF
jgi:hypothetical protein